MKRFVLILRLVLVVLMLLFIWGNSMLPAELSSRESGFVLRLLRPVVAVVQRALESRGYSFSQDYLVRKMAHFTEYAVLGVLMLVLFLRSDGRSRPGLSAAACLGVAFVDEGIQMFSEGRGPAMRDVGIDFGGACAGVLLAALVMMLLYGLTRPGGRHAAR